MKQAGFADFTETSLETLGAEIDLWRRLARQRRARGDPQDRRAARLADALKIFAREIFPAATAMAQGLTGFSGGRPEPQPVIRLFSFLIDKARRPGPACAAASISEIAPRRLRAAAQSGAARLAARASAGSATNPLVLVPLIAVAHGRSGDKGDIANIGVIGRRPEFEPALARRTDGRGGARLFRPLCARAGRALRLARACTVSTSCCIARSAAAASRRCATIRKARRWRRR